MKRIEIVGLHGDTTFSRARGFFYGAVSGICGGHELEGLVTKDEKGDEFIFMVPVNQKIYAVQFRTEAEYRSRGLSHIYCGMLFESPFGKCLYFELSVKVKPPEGLNCYLLLEPSKELSPHSWNSLAYDLHTNGRKTAKTVFFIDNPPTLTIK